MNRSKARSRNMRALLGFVLLVMIFGRSQAQTGETATVYRLSNGLVPTIYYHGTFGNYYYDPANYAPPFVAPPEPKFPIWIFAPIRPAPNGGMIVFINSGGFRSFMVDPNTTWFTPQDQMNFAQLRVEELIRPLLDRGYTVACVNHGSVYLESGPNVDPGWVSSEINEQVHAAVRAVRLAFTNGWFASLPTTAAGSFPLAASGVVRYASAGTSSGAGLALNLLIKGGTGNVKASFPDAGVTSIVTAANIDSSTYCAMTKNAALGGLNWRCANDTAFFWVFTRYLVHPDIHYCPSYIDQNGVIPPSVIYPGGLSYLDLFGGNEGVCMTITELPYRDKNNPYPDFPHYDFATPLLLELSAQRELELMIQGGTPWNRGGVLHVNGNEDGLVPIYQATLLDGLLTQAGIPVFQAVRDGEAHGWKDTDLEADVANIRFFDDQVLSVPDMDADGVRDSLDVAAVAIPTTNPPQPAPSDDPDTDGDGVTDYTERIVNPTSATAPFDPHDTFAIVKVRHIVANAPYASNQVVGGDPCNGTEPCQHYDVQIDFRGPGTSVGAFILQWTPNLPAAGYANWIDQPSTLAPITSVSNGLFKVNFHTCLNESRPTNYFRIRWVPAGGEFSRASTAPAGQSLIRIFRGNAPSPQPTWNFLGSPFHEPEVAGADFVRAAVVPNTAQSVITLEGAASGGPSAPALVDPGQNNQTLNLGGGNSTTHVAVIRRDQARKTLETHPELRGWEGRWYEVVSNTASTVTVKWQGAVGGVVGSKPYTGNLPSLSNQGIAPGSEVAIRPLSSFAGLFEGNTSSSSVINGSVSVHAALAGLVSGDLVFRYNRTTHAPIARFRYYDDGAGTRRWEKDTVWPGSNANSSQPWVQATDADMKLLPDEAFGLLAASSGNPETWTAAIGMVSMCDLSAYVYDTTSISAGSLSAETANRQIRNWPFPIDANLGNNLGVDEIFGDYETRPSSGLINSGIKIAINPVDFHLTSNTDALIYADRFIEGDTYVGDEAGFFAAGNDNPIMDDDEYRPGPVEQIWLISESKARNWNELRLMVYSLNSTINASYSTVPIRSIYFPTNDGILRAGRGYQLRIGARSGGLGTASGDAIEWKRRRPYRIPN